MYQALGEKKYMQRFGSETSTKETAWKPEAQRREYY
jgi:hypothetical protein